VQRPRDARALQWLLAPVFLAQRNETGHLGLGDRDLLAAEVRLADIGDVIVVGRGSHDCSIKAKRPHRFRCERRC
jgi:hypothetical protein